MPTIHSSCGTDAHRKRKSKSPDLDALAAAARRVHCACSRDAEEAELRAAQGGARAAHQRQRGQRLHPGRGPQPAGALGGARPRRPREGPARRPLPHRARHARHDGRRRTATRAARSTAPSGPSNGPTVGRPGDRVRAAAASETSEMPRRREVPAQASCPIRSTATGWSAQLHRTCMMRDGKKSTAERIVYGALRDHRERRRATTRWRCSAARSRTCGRASR